MINNDKWLDSSIWPTNGALIGTINLGQIVVMENEGVLHIPQSSRTGASPSDAV